MSNNTSNDFHTQPQPCSSRSLPGTGVTAFFCNCSLKVLAFFAILLALTLGLILGAVFALVLICTVPSLIVLAVILGILVIGLVIFRLCMCCHRNRCG